VEHGIRNTRQEFKAQGNKYSAVVLFVWCFGNYCNLPISKTKHGAMDPDEIGEATANGPRRRSSRLASGRKRQRLEDEDAQSAAVAGRMLSCYKPKATASALQQDCGILPSE